MNPVRCPSCAHFTRKPFIASEALLSDEAIEAMILAAATPAHDDGHTDTYYRGLMQAAITAALSEVKEEKT